MKKLTIIVLVLMAFACKPKEVVIGNTQVKEMVHYLAGDELEGRDTGSEGIDKAASYIEGKFKGWGVKPYYGSYRDYFKVEEIDGFNVVGYVEGNDNRLKDEIIVIGAHYDHIGYRSKPIEGDSIGNGANDNATGTAAVVALANYFSKRKNNKRSLVFALFSGEEMGLRGSRHLAERMKTENTNIYTVINFEMLGVPLTDRDYDVFATGYDLSNLAEKLNKYAGYKLVGKSDVAAQYNLFKRSDNYPFYEAFKVPSHTISSCDLTNFDFYHHVDDEPDKMNYDHMASAIKKLAPVIEAMSNTIEREIEMKETPGDE
jgi:Zn-dependent M28 family amino/carboxypeptidase